MLVWVSVFTIFPIRFWTVYTRSAEIQRRAAAAAPAPGDVCVRFSRVWCMDEDDSHGSDTNVRRCVCAPCRAMSSDDDDTMQKIGTGIFLFRLPSFLLFLVSTNSKWFCFRFHRFSRQYFSVVIYCEIHWIQFWWLLSAWYASHRVSPCLCAIRHTHNTYTKRHLRWHSFGRQIYWFDNSNGMFIRSEFLRSLMFRVLWGSTLKCAFNGSYHLGYC